MDLVCHGPSAVSPDAFNPPITVYILYTVLLPRAYAQQGPVKLKQCWTAGVCVRVSAKNIFFKTLPAGQLGRYNQ